ncbi:MAG TPA: cytochrome c [Verrucomicrobiae bacterium]|nr:cytochrome c [Verrucomicrobiae bacterium]
MKSIISIFLVCGALLLAGCDLQDMYEQPEYKPLEESKFFSDDKSARPLVEDTVARGELRTNEVFFAGKSGTNYVTELPLPLTRELLLRGRERYDIFCSPCHDRTGHGNGMIVQRGFAQPPSFHIDRLRGEPIGYFYNVMTHGFGKMSDYASQVPPEDRWAIAAYIRALQFSEHAPLQDVPAEERAKLEASR